MTKSKNDIFWQRLDELLATSKIVIDRPKGSRHPRFAEIVYQIDYGYLDATSSNDGEGLDVWLGSAPELGLTAVICTVDLDKRDAEMKLMVGCTPAEMKFIEDFYNTWPDMGGHIIHRE